MRGHLIIAGLILVAAAFLWNVLKKERILQEGENVLLALAPVDPRSLMQGDYMVLRYHIADQIAEHLSEDEQQTRVDGTLVLGVDTRGVGTFRRLKDTETPLAQGETLLRYRLRGDTIQLGAESFLFEEGSADTYALARYGELRVDEDGSSILIGLRDKDLKVLGAEQRQH